MPADEPHAQAPGAMVIGRLPIAIVGVAELFEPYTDRIEN
jgi:hypothetical protein